MPTRIRCKRIGSKKRNIMRIVVTDGRFPRDGRFIEEIGYYNPTTKEHIVTLKAERAKYWLSVGAQPTETVRSIFKKQGIKKTGEQKIA